jgi:hypothetical protein
MLIEFYKKFQELSKIERNMDIVWKKAITETFNVGDFKKNDLDERVYREPNLEITIRQQKLTLLNMNDEENSEVIIKLGADTYEVHGRAAQIIYDWTNGIKPRTRKCKGDAIQTIKAKFGKVVAI